MRQKKFRYFVGDFETTTYKGQQYTEVWASASVEFYTDKVDIFNSLEGQFKYFKSLKENVVVYYHNLKFDGSFWLPFLIQKLGFKQAFINIDENCPYMVEWLEEKYMRNDTFKYSISSKGQWYSIIIKTNNKFIEIRDSLKLLPFSVKRIGKAFKTKHQKLDMEYVGFRYAGCEITEEEKKYIANDVLVVKEAMELMFSEGHTDLTIGACCLKEFKSFYDKTDYEMFFPDMVNLPLDVDKFGSTNVDLYIRKSYRGGWCYLVKGKENKIYKGGTTADVNSLYPSVMSSESGNRYPVGNPTFWKGNIIPDDALKTNRYYFIRIKTRLYLKNGMLPFIQIKNSFLYPANECLETTDIYDYENDRYSRYYQDKQGNIHDTSQIFTLTMTDFELLKEHYELVDFEILDGCYFYSEIGLFDEYMEKYKKQKATSEGARRELAKLFLNNLYGKMASSDDSSFKLAYVKDNGVIGFYLVPEHNKKTGYIPIGSAITSYAKNFTIRAAQKNYHGKNKRGFIYADTDSIHCDLEPHEIKGIKIHDSDFCCWKLESYWDKAIFTRQKTYIEHVIKETKKGELVNIEPHYEVKCAGMPDRCKHLFIKSLEGYTEDELKNYNEEEQEFIKTRRTLQDFKVGLIVPSQLKPKRILGGIVLNESPYRMRE